MVTMDCRTQLASMAIDEVDKGDFEMATKILTTSIRLEPNNYELYFERSICHHKLANYRASLDDANSAIRLNSSDYNIHYQKGLAQIGLSLFSEAVTSFKKAIELRAKQEDSKLSDIFKLLRDATNELNTARRRPGAAAALAASANQARLDNGNEPTIVGAVINNNVPPSSGAAKKTASADLVAAATATATAAATSHVRGTNIDPVDSTTDKLSPLAMAPRLGQLSAETQVMGGVVPDHTAGVPMGALVENGTNNLVANLNSNSNQMQSSNHVVGEGSRGTTAASIATTTSGRVSSSAAKQHLISDHADQQQLHRPAMKPFDASALPNEGHNSRICVTAPPIKGTEAASNALGNHLDHQRHHAHQQQQQHHHLHHHNHSPHSHALQHPYDTTKTPPPPPPRPPSGSAGSFEWNIRRSERIFLHNSSEPGTSGPNDDTASQSRARLGSNPSSVSSGRGGATAAAAVAAHKRPCERPGDMKQPAYPSVKTNGTSSVLDSEIDVDDSSTYSALDASGQQTRKRVMVTPSSSMPATSNQAMTAMANKREDSYSSKYKRLRRDRERARRGTTKLCTIKPADLDELHKGSGRSGADKRSMRVIAPIDGWLYSGHLSIDDNIQDADADDESPHYVVKLDGDSSGSSYLFTRDTVLNDVIKEVRVKSVSELRKGARICCYWSRTYKCLSTGVVTSRTFEATKSLVSVKYDNGDLSALPLEDLRLLPPDYPKYMSNCDPLLLAKNGDTSDPLAAPSRTSRIVVDCKSSNYPASATYSKAAKSSNPAPRCDNQPNDASMLRQCRETAGLSAERSPCAVAAKSSVGSLGRENGLPTVENMRSALDDDTIPPTDETINLITSEGNLDDTQDEDHMQIDQQGEEEEDTLIDGTILAANTETNPPSPHAPHEASPGAPSEENNYGIEYRPWMFEGPSRRSKRNGRTYRDIYSAIRRGNEVIKVGDSAELMPRDESIPPFIAKIDGLWATSRGEMRVRVRWYYRLSEAAGEPYELEDGENALFETDHFDENDIQSIWRTTKILSWTDYARNHLGHVNSPTDGPKVFYLAGHYDPVRCVKHLRSDIKAIH